MDAIEVDGDIEAADGSIEVSATVELAGTEIAASATGSTSGKLTSSIRGDIPGIASGEVGGEFDPDNDLSAGHEVDVDVKNGQATRNAEFGRSRLHANLQVRNETLAEEAHGTEPVSAIGQALVGFYQIIRRRLGR